MPGARYLRREGESLIVENSTRNVLRVFVRGDVNALRIGPDDQRRTRKSLKQAA